MSSAPVSAFGPPFGVVAIARNEGERLRHCLESLRPSGASIVYVDSGSTDGSVATARGLGVSVVELDLTHPFTAARARNEGLARLLQGHPELAFVQFIDGDCEVASGWLDLAHRTLSSRPELAVVCGRRRERYPERSIYNHLCDLEWNTPVGEARACGGDAMMRIEALKQVGGYDSSVIAGEEPELCVRLRQSGWKIERLDAEMTLHDAAMTRFGQWWKRSERAGHACAQGAAMHGRPPERHCVHEVRSNWVWGWILPILAIALAWPTRGLSLLLLGGYLLLGWRIFRSIRRRGFARGDARLYALFCVLGKVPQAWGQGKYWLNRLRGRRSALIEYKTASQAPSG